MNSLVAWDVTWRSLDVRRADDLPPAEALRIAIVTLVESVNHFRRGLVLPG